MSTMKNNMTDSWRAALFDEVEGIILGGSKGLRSVIQLNSN